ncbi:MAG: alpha-mannosidase [Anaerolineales bacterium]|nr:alpha-mannosidase [Anaerolineales bacterium]
MSHATRWTVEKITRRLGLIEPLVYRRRVPLPNFHYQPVPPDLTTPAALPDGSQAWVEIKPNTHWGQPFTDFLLRTTFQVPADWDPALPLALYLPLGDAVDFSHPEALAYVDGKPYATADRHHQEVLLRAEWADGRPHELVLHGWTGLGNWYPDNRTRLMMDTCYLVQIDPLARDFTILARVALGAAKALNLDDPARSALLNALDAAFKLLDTREPFGEPFYASLHAAHAALADGVARAGAPLDVTFTATGHAHIDVAWLWPLAQTRRKAARTFHTVLRLMEQFPAFHFTQSQPQLYEFIRQDHPELFEAIRARVLEGRWEPIGGMWVEADCNLSGAESLARQFLLGRTYFRQHFGSQAESPVLWLPDVFGYAWSLPQLIKQAGLEYFFTVKLSWNQYNRLPYDSFWWQGLDGTRVLTHFSTTPENSATTSTTYNAPATPESALGAWKNLQQKEAQNEVFMAFGYGDGGGGPTRQMAENIQQLERFPGMPQARQRSAGAFFRDLETNSGANLPVWNGELYLELHRGTYTTQSRNKRANRKTEFALHDAEFLACLATSLDPDYLYPTEVLRQAWQLVCLNQFHDIIPGSSIGLVYQESLAQYAEAQRSASAVRQQALALISSKLGGDVILINPTSFSQSGSFFIPEISSCGLVRQGQPLLTQPTEGGVLVDAGELPPYSATSLDCTAGPAPLPATIPETFCLDNNCLRLEFNPQGDITRIFDKTNSREVLSPGTVANQFQAFEDRPKDWDAWDIDIYYDDRMWLAEPASSIQWIETGPLRWTIEITRRILNSTCTQRISLRRNSPRLDFDTRIDWRERHILLKVAFPVDILSPLATHEIQWGNVQRPTHRNTSWDWARFETCAHKWVDLSEGGYGVSLLNDCKYGHDIQENVIRLSLLRSPTLPDPEADQGEHRFLYSLLPHADGWEAVTAAEAYAINDPVISYPVTSPTTRQALEAPVSLIQASSPHIIIETIKRAEDGAGYIVRLYESQRRRGAVTLHTAFPLAGAYQCNLLEENQCELPHQANQVNLTVRPYEILTLRLVEK